MSDLDWTRGPSRELLPPDFDRPRCWKERPIDVRAEAAAQVDSQRRAEVRARRIEKWRAEVRATGTEEKREQRVSTKAPGRIAVPRGAKPIREPAVRRRRKRDPGYPSSMFRYGGEKGLAYIDAWRDYSWGMAPRPEPWDKFSAEEPRECSNPLPRLIAGTWKMLKP